MRHQLHSYIPQPRKAFIEVCASQPVAIPGTLPDRLIKGAQPVTDKCLQLRADPHATDAHWQILRDYFQASPYASSMKGFFEGCLLKRMPEIDSVGASGAT